MKVLGVIPARYDSSRFLGKPLALISRKPMIQWVYERAMKSDLIDRLIVATDDERILKRVIKFGGRVVMTSKSHKCGTERVAEVSKKFPSDLVVNIQGDEPLVNGRDLDSAIDVFNNSSYENSIAISTLGTRIRENEFENPNVVKVWVDEVGLARKFSRRILKGYNGWQLFKHVGIYVYSRDFLMQLISMKPTEGERREKLEQLRVLENGYMIKVVKTKGDWISVDVPSDVKKVEKILGK